MLTAGRRAGEYNRGMRSTPKTIQNPQLTSGAPRIKYFEHEEEIRYGFPAGLTISGFIGKKRDSRALATDIP